MENHLQLGYSSIARLIRSEPFRTGYKSPLFLYFSDRNFPRIFDPIRQKVLVNKEYYYSDIINRSNFHKENCCYIRGISIILTKYNFIEKIIFHFIGQS